MATEAPPHPPVAGTGAAVAATDVSGAVPFPRYSVALVQNESEMLQAPSYDIHIFLENDPVFDVELFTERSFRTLPGESARYDCIVIGYNAAHKSQLIREALAEQPPTVGLCVLHQLDARGLSFLEERVSQRAFAEAEEAVTMARGREPADEILLNWPQHVALDGLALPGASAWSGLVPGPESRWRTVLEVERHRRVYPVLLRAPTREDHQVVVCSALLSQTRATHAALLKNMITWCAAGRPDVVVVEPPDESWSSVVHRKLRLQGARAISQPVASASALDFRDWPFRGVANVILPPDWEPLAADGSERIAGVREWLDREGRIVSIESDGNLVIRHGASDARWIARQWAGWFAGQPTSSWHGEQPQDGSIVRTRAVLRALAELRDGIGDDTADRLGLPRPTEFAEPCAGLLRERLGRSGTSVEGTVSATTAALEIDRAIGNHALGARQRSRIEKWLRARASDVDENGRPVLAAEDRLEVARCLADEALLLQVVADLVEERGGEAKATAAILVTKLREAVVRTGLDPAQIDATLCDPDNRSVDPDVRESPLLAANYLIAWGELKSSSLGKPDDPLVAEPPAAIDRVIIAIGKHGVLVTGRTAGMEHPHELVSAEALALLAYFQRHKAATHMLPGAGVTPPELIISLVQEARDLRIRNASIPVLERTARWGRSIAGVFALIIVAAASYLLDKSGFALPVAGDLTIPLAATGLLLLLTWLLSLVDLQAQWLGAVADWVRKRADLGDGKKPAAAAESGPPGAERGRDPA